MARSNYLSLFKNYCENFNDNFYRGMPKRNLNLIFQLDANQINARGKDTNINKLEIWHNRKIIFLEMSCLAFDEAIYGNKCRSDKADNYTEIFPNVTWVGYNEFRNIIGNILFPNGAKKRNDKNDIDVLLIAKLSHATLITNDHKHILHNADSLLSRVGIRVISAEQAVTEIKKCIRYRDRAAMKIAKINGLNIPKWVGRDI